MRERADGAAPIQVHALPETLAALRTHIFNGVIWPDFTRLPSAEHPMLALVPFAVGEVLELNGKRVEVLDAVAHRAGGRLRASMAAPRGWWVYTGDTGPEPGALGAAARHARSPTS